MAAPLARAVAAAAAPQQSVVLHIALSAKLAMHAMSSFVYLVFFIPSQCLLAACALGAILGPAEARPHSPAPFFAAGLI